MTDAQKKKKEEANCKPNPWFDLIDVKADPIRPGHPDYAKWKDFESKVRQQPNYKAKKKELGPGEEPDHILAARALWELPNFKNLPLKSQLEIADDPANLRPLNGSINGSKGGHPASQYGQTWFPSPRVDDKITPEELAAMCEAEEEATPVIMFLISQKLAENPTSAGAEGGTGEGEGTGSDTSASTSGLDSDSDSGNTATPTLTSVPTPTDVPYTPPQTIPETPGTPEYPTGTPAQPPATENPPAAPPTPTQTEKSADVPAPTTQAAPEPAKGGWWSRNWKKVAVGVGVGALVAGGVACVVATAGICAAVGAGAAGAGGAAAAGGGAAAAGAGGAAAPAAVGAGAAAVGVAADYALAG